MKKKLWKFVAASLCVFAAVSAAAISLCFPLRYGAEIRSECERFGVDEALVRAVVWTESKYHSGAVSSAGAAGLMQLMPSTAAWCAESLGIAYEYDLLFLPSYNLKLGVFYLKYLIDKYGELGAITAYNAGEGNYVKYGGEVPFRETTEYVRRVRSAYRVYRIKLT